MRVLAMPAATALRAIQIPSGDRLAWSLDGRRLIVAGRRQLHCFTREGRLYCRITLSERGCLWETPAGFFHTTGESPPSRLAMAALDTSLPAIVRPVEALAARLHRRERVEAALSLDLSGDDITPELSALGWWSPVIRV